MECGWAGILLHEKELCISAKYVLVFSGRDIVAPEVGHWASMQESGNVATHGGEYDTHVMFFVNHEENENP